MKIEENRIYRIYDKSLHQWFDVSKDYFEVYDQQRTNYRKRKQYHGRCCCLRNKWWLCDMMCDDCEFRRAGDTLSLDAPEGDGSVSILDQQEASGPRMEDVIADRLLLQQLIQRLREFDPDANRIIQMLGEEMSDRAIAKALGRPQRTFADQMKRYRTELRKIRGY